MRVCYHIETHSHLEQVERLVRLIHAEAPDSQVVVSHDVRAVPLSRELGDLPRVTVRRDVGGYGDLRHVSRWLDTAQWLTDRGESFGWLVNLSGQCYPLRPLAHIEADLDAATVGGTDAFIESFVVHSAESRWPARLARDRYSFRHRRLGPPRPGRTRTARWVSAVSHAQPLVRYGSATGPTLGLRRPLPPELRQGRLRGGSFFGAFGPRAVGRLLRTARDRPQLMAWFAGSVSPAEVFFQTVLEEFGDLNLVRNNRRFADFSRALGNHPAVLDETAVRQALGRDADFARKFDEDSHPGLLALVDESRASQLIAERDRPMTRSDAGLARTDALVP